MKFIFFCLITFNLFSAEQNQQLLDGLLKQNEQLTKIIEDNNKIIYSAQDSAPSTVSKSESELSVSSKPSKQFFSITLNYTSLSGYNDLINNDGTDLSLSNQPALSLGISPYSNVWLEGSVGQSVIDDYPSTGLGTAITSVSFRAKYDYDVMNSGWIISPYLGYQVINASSPGAGQADPNLALSSEYYTNELLLVEEIETNRVIFGGGLSRVFFKNWQARVEFGSDWLSAGLGYRL